MVDSYYRDFITNHYLKKKKKITEDEINETANEYLEGLKGKLGNVYQ